MLTCAPQISIRHTSFQSSKCHHFTPQALLKRMRADISHACMLGGWMGATMSFVSPGYATALSEWPEGNIKPLTITYRRRWGGSGRRCIGCHQIVPQPSPKGERVIDDHPQSCIAGGGAAGGDDVLRGAGAAAQRAARRHGDGAHGLRPAGAGARRLHGAHGAARQGPGGPHRPLRPQLQRQKGAPLALAA